MRGARLRNVVTRDNSAFLASGSVLEATLKYPDMFAAADLLLLDKSDLPPHLSFDVDACLANALRVSPRLQTLLVSAGRGLAPGSALERISSSKNIWRLARF